MTNEADSAPGLDALFSPVSLTEFQRAYWPHHVLISDAGPERLPSFFTAPELSDVRAILSAHWGQVKVIADDPQLFNEEIVSAREARAFYEAGSTICLLHAHRSIPVVGRWAQLLARALEVPPYLVHCSAYASPDGQGTPKHFDNNEVIVLQLGGSKRWQMSPNLDFPYPTRNFVAGMSPYAELPYSLFDASREMPEGSTRFVMEPGATLFIPRGVWHATSAGDASLSLSFGFATPTPLDLLLAALKSELSTHTFLRKPLSRLADGQRFEKLNDRVSELLRECLDDEGTAD